MQVDKKLFDENWLAHGTRTPNGIKQEWTDEDEIEAKQEKELANICLNCTSEKCIGTCERYRKLSREVKKKYKAEKEKLKITKST